MKKFWMVTMIAILFGLTTTGCPDGDDDYDTDADMDSDSDAGSDADAETDTAEDGTTDETADCPSVAGEWALTYHSDATGFDEHYILTLEQSGCSLSGYDDDGGAFSGTVNEDGSLSGAITVVPVH
ncbi:MAG: hypothetical protein WC445_02670 [Patescibacteria group bacterium]